MSTQDILEGLLPCPGCDGHVTMSREVEPPDEYTRYSHFVYVIHCLECGVDFRRRSFHAWEGEGEEDGQDQEAKASISRTWNHMLYRGALSKQVVSGRIEPQEDKTDVVDRLLAGAGGGSHWMELHREAAATIQSLRGEVSLLSGEDRLAYLAAMVNEANTPLPPWATGEAHGDYTLVGAILPTKDGRRVGNAIVARSLGVFIGVQNDLEVFLVVTDSGNGMKVTIREMADQFYPPRWVSRVWDHPGVLRYYAGRREQESRSIQEAIVAGRMTSTLGRDIKEGDVIQGFFFHSGSTFPAAQVLRVYPDSVSSPGVREVKVAYLAGPGGRTVYPSAPMVLHVLSHYPVVDAGTRNP